MKTIKLFDRELIFCNEELEIACYLCFEMGYKVYTFNPSGYKISQIFVSNGITFGSIHECYSGVRYSTCHKSERNSGNGTGFGLTSDPMCASKEWIDRIFMFAPHWAKNKHLIKKETWGEYLSRSCNSILKYEEITIDKIY